MSKKQSKHVENDMNGENELVEQDIQDENVQVEKEVEAAEYEQEQGQRYDDKQGSSDEDVRRENIGGGFFEGLIRPGCLRHGFSSLTGEDPDEYLTCLMTA